VRLYVVCATTGSSPSVQPGSPHTTEQFVVHHVQRLQ